MVFDLNQKETLKRALVSCLEKDREIRRIVIFGALQALAWDFALTQRLMVRVRSGTQEIRKYGRRQNRVA